MKCSPFTYFCTQVDKNSCYTQESRVGLDILFPCTPKSCICWKIYQLCFDKM